MPKRRDPSGHTSVLDGPMRYVVFFLLATQLGVGPVVALTDLPPAPTYHTEHLGNSGDPACQPFHDELACLTCRVLTTYHLAAEAVPALPIPAFDTDGSAPAGSHLTPENGLLSLLRARAPPSS